MKPKIAIVRGKFLNRYEMQFFEPLAKDFDITAFGSLTPYHDQFAFPVVKLPSPMDLPDFPYNMPLLNRMFIDAHYLFGLEHKLHDFDIIHSAETYFRYTQQCLNARGHAKVIATVLENIPFNNEGIWGRKAFKARARSELDHMIALTQKTKEALITEGSDPSRITVISHFVDTKRFFPAQKKNSKKITILFVGRLEEEKGVLDLIEVINILTKDTSLQKYPFQFVFCGKGTIRIQDMHVHVKYANYDDMPQVYREADIFVAPSKPTPTWDEQYNTSLIEAQASGLPIVTTRSGGIPENVGDAALLVSPGDVGAIVTAIKRFIVSPAVRREYGAKARERAETIHDIAIGAQKLKELYLRLLA